MTSFSYRKLYSYAFITLAAVLFTIGIQAFLQIAIIFKSGIAAFAAVPTFILGEDSYFLKPFISIFYLLLNLPLIIYYWNKNSRKFTYRSIYFLLVQAALGTIFLIPQLFNWLQNPMNITLPKGEALRDLQWPIILYSVIGAVLSGTGMAIAWKYGGSSGGADIIAYYWTTKKKMNIGKAMLIISTIFLIISFVITIVLNKDVRKYWLTTLIASIIYMLVSIRLVNAIFPKYQKISFHIVPEKEKAVCEFLSESGHVHSWKIFKFQSGMYKNERIEITTTLFRLEANEFVKNLYKVDPNLWLQMLPVTNVRGKMNAYKVDNLHD